MLTQKSKLEEPMAQAPTATEPDRQSLAAPMPATSLDDGLFHGRLVLRESQSLRPLSGAAILRISAAADVEVQEVDGQRDEILMARFTNDGEGGFRPSALAGDPIDALNGSWSMPIPGEDMIVLDVESSGVTYRPATTSLISADTKSATVVVEPVEDGSLAVIDAAGISITRGVSVRSGFDLPMGLSLIHI